MFQLRGSRSACRPPNGPQNNIRQKGPNYDRTAIPQQQNRRGRETKQDKIKGKRIKERTKRMKYLTKKEMLLLFLFYVKLLIITLCETHLAI